MKDGERGRPIENYGKKEQKGWLDNTLPDPHPCTAEIKDIYVHDFNFTPLFRLCVSIKAATPFVFPSFFLAMSAPVTSECH